MASAPRFNLRLRLILLVALALMPALSLTAWSGFRERRNDAARVQAETLRIARLSAVTHRHVIESAQHLLATLSLVPEIRANQAAASTTMLTALHARFTAYTLLLAAYPNGFTYADSVGGKQIDIHDRVYFKRAMANQGFAVGNYAIGRISRRPTLHCAHTVTHLNGSPAGVVVAGIDLSWLGQVADTASLPPGSVLTVLDSDDVILARTLEPERFIGTTAPDPLHATAEGSFRKIGIDGVERIYGFTQLTTPDGDAIGTIVVGIPVSVAFAAADHDLMINLLLVAATGLLALGVGYLLARRLIVAPINNLCAATERIADGDFSVSLPAFSGEFTTLANSVTVMAASLARRDEEQRLAANELQRAHERVHAIFTAAPVAMIILDTAGRLVDGWNLAAQRLYGWQRDELLGQIPELVAPADRELWHSTLALQDHTGVVGREMDHQRRDGTTVRVSVYASVLHDNLGQPVGTLVMIADVSDNRRLQDQINQTQKLELVGRLAGGIAHDFNNLLAVITGYADLLVKRLPDTENHKIHKEQAVHILRASERAAELTGRLLSLSRRQTTKRTLIDVSTRVADMTRLLARAVGDQVELRLALGAEPCLVLADPVQLDQVVMNLVLNARDALPTGGSVSLATANDDTCVHLTVTDTGTGMEPGVLARIFEPFFTTKAPGKGTGLGLATVKAIVESSQGTITITSALGLGTTIHITLPRAGAPATDTAPAVVRSLPASVLVVDDEEGVRALMVAALSAAGISTRSATDAKDALAAIARDGVPAAVITDLIMPGTSGAALARELRRLHPGLPILFVSGYADETMVKDVLAFGGASTFLSKPFTASALVEAMRILGA